MQELLVWHQGKIFVDCSLQKLHEALEDKEGMAWLDLEVGDDLAKYEPMLLNEFHLTQLTLDTIREEIERSRLVGQHGYFYLVMHGLNFDATTGEEETPKIDIAFGKNFLVTVHRKPMQWLDNIQESARTDEGDDNIMCRGAALLLHALLDALVDSYFPVLDELDDLVDDLEEDTIQKANDEVQARLFRTKRSLAQMRRVISPQIEVLNALITRTGNLIPTEIEPYFADVHDHLVRTFEVIDSYRDLMSGLLDVYLSTVSNRLNQIMKQLTIISTIFLPITFITGVFGQNFGHSPQVEYDAGYNFWIVLAIMVLLTASQLAYFRYRKWF